MIGGRPGKAGPTCHAKGIGKSTELRYILRYVHKGAPATGGLLSVFRPETGMMEK